MHPRIGEAPREGLAAMFYSDGKEYWLHVGKSGTARFTQTEVSIVDECARFIVSHADVIVSGYASAAIDKCDRTSGILCQNQKMA